MEVVDVATGESLNFAGDDEYLGRNSYANRGVPVRVGRHDVQAVRRPATPVPNGTYRIELSALKALGNANNPAHTERWTSPNITIVRP